MDEFEQQSHETQSERNQVDIRRENRRLSCSVENNMNISSPTTGQNSRVPEGGFGWCVVLAAIWVNGSIFAIQNSFSILHVMLVEFNQATNENVSQFQIAWVGALSLGMIFFCSPLVSMCTDRFGCRPTAVAGSLVAFLGLLTSSFANSLALQYFTYGLLFGAGCSFSLQPSLVILGRYFQRRLGLVNGVVTAGSSLFSMVLPVLLEEVLAPLGLGKTLQILSVLPLLQAVLVGVAFRPLSIPCHIDRTNDKTEPDKHRCDNGGHGCYVNREYRHDENCVADHRKDSSSCCDQLPQEGKHNLQSCSETEKSRRSLPNNESVKPVQQQKLAEERKSCSLTVFHVPTYRLWSFGVAIAVLGYFVPYVHLMSFVEEQFADSDRKEWILLVCIGASSGVGRLMFGRIGDLLPGLKKLYLQGVSLMVLGLASVVIPVCVALEGLAVVCVILGVCDGCLITLMAPIAFEVLGVKRASQGIGCMLGLMALPMTAGPPLAGLLHDRFGSYHLAFYLAGVPPLTGGLLLLIIPKMHHHWWAAHPELTPEPFGASGLCSGDTSHNSELRLNEGEITQL